MKVDFRENGVIAAAAAGVGDGDGALYRIAPVAVAVLDNATPEVIEAARKGEISINKAYITIQKIPKKHHNSRYWKQLIPNAQITAQEGKDIEATIALLQRAIDILRGEIAE